MPSINVIATVQFVEYDFNTQCHQRPNQCCPDQPQCAFDIQFRRTWQVPDGDHIAKYKGEPIATAIVGKTAQQKENNKQAATHP